MMNDARVAPLVGASLEMNPYDPLRAGLVLGIDLASGSDFYLGPSLGFSAFDLSTGIALGDGGDDEEKVRGRWTGVLARSLPAFRSAALIRANGPGRAGARRRRDREQPRDGDRDADREPGEETERVT
jgi:hypothetical protein